MRASDRGTNGMTDRKDKYGRTKSYRAWRMMMTRCYNPNHESWPLYGGRGIRVCDSWKNSFHAFLADMGHPPSDDHSLDRYPNMNGHYEPGNVRWATAKEQSRNRRSNRLLTCWGRTKTMVEWAEEIGLSCEGIAARIGRGWPLERTLATPRGHGRPRTRSKWMKEAQAL